MGGGGLFQSKVVMKIKKGWKYHTLPWEGQDENTIENDSQQKHDVQNLCGGMYDNPKQL